MRWDQEKEACIHEQGLDLDSPVLITIYIIPLYCIAFIYWFIHAPILLLLNSSHFISSGPSSGQAYSCPEMRSLLCGRHSTRRTRAPSSTELSSDGSRTSTPHSIRTKLPWTVVSEVDCSEVDCSEVKWTEVKWSGVKCQWAYHRSTLPTLPFSTLPYPILPYSTLPSVVVIWFDCTTIYIILYSMQWMTSMS